MSGLSGLEKKILTLLRAEAKGLAGLTIRERLYAEFGPRYSITKVLHSLRCLETRELLTSHMEGVHRIYQSRHPAGPPP